ncbi:MAG TPA: SPFH domain-containing protein [Acidimicrobiia bacterium]|jgi:regulator of protease activity HflC (stomatin/prohibitin superfamily)|nr:SPFH domain-containing protein [Acidimicrobiia bacterium]
MFWLVSSIILVLAAIVLFALGRYTYTDHEGSEHHFRLGRYGFAALGVGALFLFLACFRIVAPGHVGVPVVLGKAGSAQGSGIHFVNPLTSMKTVSVQTQVYVLVANPSEGNPGDDSVEVRGSDQATGKVNARLNWNQTQGTATEVYKTYGGDVLTRLVRPTTRSCLNDAAINNTLALDASTGRAAFEHEASVCIDKAFSKAGIVFDDLAIAEITLPDTVQQAVNDKAASFSELAAQQNKAQGVRIAALGQADSQQIIKCGGLSETLANGTTTIKPNTDANGVCKGPSRLSADYLQYLYIQALSTNAGSSNHTVFVVPPGTDLNALINAGK